MLFNVWVAKHKWEWSDGRRCTANSCWRLVPNCTLCLFSSFVVIFHQNEWTLNSVVVVRQFYFISFFFLSVPRTQTIQLSNYDKQRARSHTQTMNNIHCQLNDWIRCAAFYCVLRSAEPVNIRRTNISAQVQVHRVTLLHFFRFSFIKTNWN